MKTHWADLNTSRTIASLVTAAMFTLVAPGQAQWLTQSFELKDGWNAVFLHVDLSHTNLNGLVANDPANPIQEIWRWNPPSAAQFIDSPAEPTSSSEWTSWNRTNVVSDLQRLVGNSAYLVRVATNGAPYTWMLKGRPVAPRPKWTISGLNFIGFSTVANSPPSFRAFLAQAPELQSIAPEVFAYVGGDLGTNNPKAIIGSLLQQMIPVQRGQAFWMRSGTVFNRYFGPFEVVLVGDTGVDFRDSANRYTFRLRNLTANPLTVDMQLVASERPPPGQPNIATEPPLLIRGSLNFTNLTYGYTTLSANTPSSWTLAARDQPGSEVEVVLGLNRAAITAPVGALLAGILRFTDSLGLSQVDLPVSALASSQAGLWVGSAEVTHVGQYLKTYARGTVTNYVPMATTDTNYVAPSLTNTVAVVTTNALLTDLHGSYIVTSTNTELEPVPQSYPLRLIVHNPEAGGDAVLLQRVYIGFDQATNVIVSNGESALHPQYLHAARRISATHLPWTATNVAWPLAGNLAQQTNLTATVPLAYDDQASNPFLHTYHPDHDNLNASFKTTLSRGSESYTVERIIRLQIKSPEDDFSSLVAGAETITGDYQETITLLGLGERRRDYHVSGTFTLNRIIQVPTLTFAP